MANTEYGYSPEIFRQKAFRAKGWTAKNWRYPPRTKLRRTNDRGWTKHIAGRTIKTVAAIVTRWRKLFPEDDIWVQLPSKANTE